MRLTGRLTRSLRTTRCRCILITLITIGLPLKPDARAAVKKHADKFASDLILHAKLEASAEQYKHVTAKHVNDALASFMQNWQLPTLSREFGPQIGGLVAGTAVCQFIAEFQLAGGARLLFSLGYVALLILGIGFMLSGSMQRR